MTGCMTGYQTFGWGTSTSGTTGPSGTLGNLISTRELQKVRLSTVDSLPEPTPEDVRNRLRHHVARGEQEAANRWLLTVDETQRPQHARAVPHASLPVGKRDYFKICHRSGAPYLFDGGDLAPSPQFSDASLADPYDAARQQVMRERVSCDALLPQTKFHAPWYNAHW